MLTEADYGVFRIVVRADTGPLGGVVEGSREITIAK
jgi:hypothetical protein